MKIPKAALFTSLLIASSLLFAGCSDTPASKPSNQNQQAATQKQDDKTKSENVQKNGTSKQNSSGNAQTNDSASSITFNVVEKEKYTPTFPSAWKSSPSSHYQVTIDGRGENSQEEGQGTIVVENKETLHSTLFSLPESMGSSLTPKYAEWKNDHILYIIIGYPYGTISKGGNLYELNLDTHAVTPVIVNLPEKEEIISVYKNGTTFMYKKNVYEDDNFTKSHIIEGIVPEVQN